MNDVPEWVKIIISLLVAICVLLVITDQPRQEAEREEKTEQTDPEPLVIDTSNDVLLTVIDEKGQEVFQYAGEVKDWTVEGERYMNIYINRVGEE